MKKIAVLLMLVLLYSGWLLGGENQVASLGYQEDIKLLRQAFGATDANPSGAELYAWVKLGDKYYSPREAEEVVIVLAREFDLNRNEFDIQYRATGHYGYAIVDYDLTETVKLRIQVQSLDKETLASIEIKQQHHRDLEHTYNKVRQALQKQAPLGEEVKITSCLEGYLDVRLRDSEKLNMAYAAFNAVEANFQEGIDTSGVSSLSCWSPLFEQSTSIGHKEVNFGIAFRTANNQRTIIRVATPVLPGSY